MFRHSSRFSLLICLTLCICLLSACGAQSETPETAVTNALNAVKALDTATMQKYFDPDDQIFNISEDDAMTESDQAIMQGIVKNLSFEVTDSSVDGDKATVSIAITNTDMRDDRRSVLTAFYPRCVPVCFPARRSAAQRRRDGRNVYAAFSRSDGQGGQSHHHHQYRYPLDQSGKQLDHQRRYASLGRYLRRLSLCHAEYSLFLRRTCRIMLKRHASTDSRSYSETAC